jgi:hypothetical protein
MGLFRIAKELIQLGPLRAQCQPGTKSCGEESDAFTAERNRWDAKNTLFVPVLHHSRIGGFWAQAHSSKAMSCHITAIAHASVQQIQYGI